MNPDIICNLYSQAQYYQQYYYFPQQQFLQYMMLQNQTPTLPILQYKYDTPTLLNSGITQQSIESVNTTKTVQNNHTTEVNSGQQEKCPSIEDDSQSRVNGHWTKQEHLQYLEFVKSHESILKSKYDKKSKIFKLMSQFIPTRTATQCRSHHQKFNPFSKSKKKSRFTNKIPTVIQS